MQTAKEAFEKFIEQATLRVKQEKRRRTIAPIVVVLVAVVIELLTAEVVTTLVLAKRMLAFLTDVVHTAVEQAKP